ncbi:MAG: ABC transporter permease [Pseudomonadota bacterium]|nr:ABC transporter permease [Pseudomonadota bacterium]
MVFFWTDTLIFLVLGSLLLAFLRFGRKEQWLRPWRKLTSDKPAMISLVILVVFLLIGLLDSIRFYPAHATASTGSVIVQGEPISLFDVWATTIRTHDEKTYSAPFASHLYTRERLPDGVGSSTWGYARLVHGGVHLEEQDSGIYDILQTVVQGAAKGLLFAGLLMFSTVIFWSRKKSTSIVKEIRQLFSDDYSRPWRSVLATGTLILCISWALADLSVHYHVLGTDKVGQDVLYQSLKSIRTGLVIGCLTTFVMLPFALVLGIVSGYYRGWVDDLIQYIYTTLNSIPGVLLIAASILVVQVYMSNHAEAFDTVAVRADTRLLFLCLVLGMTSWTGLCRLLRAETLKLREMEYVQAARALGVGDPGILARHILPNLFHIVLISVTLDFSGLVLAEAVLSYINIGVDPTTFSWGNMINSARLEMAREPVVWWPLFAAFLFMFILVLSANLFADGVRDALDPRHQSGER